MLIGSGVRRGGYWDLVTVSRPTGASAQAMRCPSSSYCSHHLSFLGQFTDDPFDSRRRAVDRRRGVGGASIAQKCATLTIPAPVSENRLAISASRRHQRPGFAQGRRAATESRRASAIGSGKRITAWKPGETPRRRSCAGWSPGSPARHGSPSAAADRRPLVRVPVVGVADLRCLPNRASASSKNRIRSGARPSNMREVLLGLADVLGHHS